MYWFVTEIVSGDAGIDSAQVRFGFREFWIEGPDFVLNGSKVRLMGESGVWPKWDPRPGEETPRPGRPWSSRDRPGVEALFRAYKEMNMTALRLHYRIGSRVEIEVAEELGLLAHPPIGDLDPGRSPINEEDPSFFAICGGSSTSGSSVTAIAPPSSSGTWKTRSCAGGRPSTRPWAFELDSWVKELDPSRVILHSGGGKFGEQAHAYSFHMAENYDPVFRAWSKDPDKPVILGEWWIGRQVHHGGGMLVPYGWTQTRSEIDPHHLGRRDRIEMHRLAGVNTMPFDFDRSLIYPVLPMSTGRVAVDPMAAALYRDAFSPLFVGLKERGATAVAGERLQRTAVVINDTPRDQGGFVALYPRSCRSGHEIGVRGGSGSPFGYPKRSHGGREVALEFVVPTGGGGLSWSSMCDRTGEGATGSPRVSHDNAHTSTFFRRSAQAVSGLSSPMSSSIRRGPIVAWMERHGIEHVDRRSTGRAASPAYPLTSSMGPVLIIGRDALATLPPSDAQGLHEFVRQGGRVAHHGAGGAVAAGSSLASSGLAPAYTLVAGRARLLVRRHLGPLQRADPRGPVDRQRSVDEPVRGGAADGSPGRPGLPSQLLAHWRAGDGRVVDDAIQVPGGIAAPPPGVTPIVGAVGPDNASLVEVRNGDGLYLINQLEIVPNLDVDPAATRLFLNMLSYLEPEVLDDPASTGPGPGRGADRDRPLRSQRMEPATR